MEKPKTISFKHSGNAGDIIYSLAGIQKVTGDLGMKADFTMWLDREARYYDGAVHPLGNKTLNDYMYENLKPLLEAQPYISTVDRYKGQKIQIDLDLVRQRDIGMPYGNIAYWYGYIFPDMLCDSSIPWLHVEEKYSELRNTIIVNRTQRYQNPHITYAFLRNCPEDVMFVGTHGEYELVKREIPKMAYLEVDNFYDLACAIKSCKFFIGNQSMCFGIAEAIKAPRILEICTFAPNVIPSGPGPAGHYFSQQAFEWFVEDFRKKRAVKNVFSKEIQQQLNLSFEQQVKDTRSQMEKYFEDEILPHLHGKTLVDIDRLKRLAQFTLQTNLIEGDIAEIGVYKGGTAYLMAKCSQKSLFLFDTFKGMPKVSSHDLHHEGDFADTSLQEVGRFVSSARTNSKDIHFVEGVFPQSAPKIVEDRQFSLVHIDVDIYQSVKDCLEYFYPRMIKGGIIVLDDVLEPNCPGAKRAFEEFMQGKPESLEGLGFEPCYSQVAFVKR